MAPSQRWLGFLGLIVVSAAAAVYGCSSDESKDTTSDAGTTKVDSGVGTTPSPTSSSTTDPLKDADAPLTAKTAILPLGSSTINGTASFTETAAGIMVTVNLKDGPPGKHGLHVHAGTDCGDAGANALGHFNPSDAGHGLPGSGMHHGGDLGNITLDDAGAGTSSLTVMGITLKPGDTSINGRAVVVHANEDDGTAGDAGPGNSGARIGCGVVKND